MLEECSYREKVTDWDGVRQVQLAEVYGTRNFLYPQTKEVSNNCEPTSNELTMNQ